jgi:hypothetical protein
MKLIKRIGHWTVACAMALMAAPAWASVWHVSPEGKPGNDGSERAPLDSIKAAIEAAAKAGDACEIILHAGVYPGDILIPAPAGMADPAKTPAWVIRAARKPQEASESYEEVVIDGGRKVTGASLVDQPNGVYFLPMALGNTEPGMWDLKTHTRYIYSADRRAVEAFGGSLAPGKFPVNGQLVEGIFFKTTDGKPPADHDLGMARDKFGMVVQRPNVTIKGLKFKNFQLHFGVKALSLEAPGVTVDACHAHNSYGLATVSEKVRDVKILNCSAWDAANGVKSYGINTVVENCRFYRVDDAFVVREYEQDQSGIQFYSSNTQTARGNLCVGFQTGVFIKASGGVAVIENNTVVAGLGGGERGLGPNTWRPGSICRGNVAVGFVEPIGVENDGKEIAKDVIITDNLVYMAVNPERAVELMRRVKEMTGGVNVVDRPRFVDQAKGDYRLSAASAGAKMGVGGRPIGAMGAAPASEPDKTGPTLKVAVMPPARALGLRSRMYVKKNTWIGGKTPELIEEGMLDEAGGQSVTWLTPTGEISLKITAEDAAGRVTQARYRVNGGSWSAAMALKESITVPLAKGDKAARVEVQVSDDSGNWSDSAQVLAAVASQPPVLVGKPVITASDKGVVMSFVTDTPCLATLVWGAGEKFDKRTGDAAETRFTFNNVMGLEWNQEIDGPRREHCLVLTGMTPGEACGYRLMLGYDGGTQVEAAAGRFTANGPARTLHVAVDGVDAENAGLKDKPFKTIQFAVDRALPGDRVLVGPGLYSQSVSVRHGGAAGAPIRIESAQPWGAVLDGRRESGAGFRLSRVSHVEIVGFEVRWQNQYGIIAFDANDLVIQGCRFWDRHWVKGRPSAMDGIVLYHCKNITMDGNVVFALNSGFRISESDNLRITHNTAVRCFHRVAQINYSGDVHLRNNSFAFGSSYLLSMVMTQAQLMSIDSDYNNFAVHLRSDSESYKRALPEELLVREPDDFYYGESKGLADWVGPHDETFKHGAVLNMGTLSLWSKTTGQDKHSVFIHPRYVDPQNRDFRLLPQSPNAGKGEGGSDIGALGVAR